MIKTLNLRRENPFLKKFNLSEIIKLNETFNLCDIWRVRNPHKNYSLSDKKLFTRIIQRRLDYIFVSNSLQESVKKNRNSKCLISDRSPPFSAPLLTMILLFVDQVFGNSIILNCSILILLKNHNLILKLLK